MKYATVNVLPMISDDVHIRDGIISRSLFVFFDTLV